MLLLSSLIKAVPLAGAGYLPPPEPRPAAETPSIATPPIMAFYNELIFLPHLFTGPFDLSCLPEQLLRWMLGDPSAVRGIGYIYVASAKYWKLFDSTEHEFLSFEVKSSIDRRVSTIVIHRVPPTRSYLDTLGIRRANTFFENNQYNVDIEDIHIVDRCRVSYSGDFDGLARRLGIGSRKCLMEITFHDQTFTLEQLLLASQAVSMHETRHALFRARGHWFAFMLWELIQRITGTTANTTATPPILAIGKMLGFYRLTPWLLVNCKEYQEAERHAELETLITRYTTLWESFQVKLPLIKARYGLVAEVVQS